MSRDKQIEEMANAILYQGDNYDTCCKDDCQTIASLIYNAGYRKASEVAREIIKDLVKFADDKERQMNFHGHSVWYMNADDVTDFIAELKKKYTEGGE